MMSKRVIKRYQNRKLYDSTTGRYVNLSDLETPFARMSSLVNRGRL